VLSLSLKFNNVKWNITILFQLPFFFFLLFFVSSWTAIANTFTTYKKPNLFLIQNKVMIFFFLFQSDGSSKVKEKQ